jgi:hypothetical protein
MYINEECETFDASPFGFYSSFKENEKIAIDA